MKPKVVRQVLGRLAQATKNAQPEVDVMLVTGWMCRGNARIDTVSNTGSFSIAMLNDGKPTMHVDPEAIIVIATRGSIQNKE